MAGPSPVPALKNTPSDFNLSFGKNIFTLEDTGGATDQVKFGLNIFSGTSTGDTQVATLRQFENPAGTAHFDLQNILKNYTTPNPDLQSSTGLTDGSYETFRFIGTVGNEIGGAFDVSQTITGDTGSYCVLGGRKDFDDLLWSEGYSAHVPRISEIFGCPAAVSRASALTDWNGPRTTDYSSETPSWAQGTPTYTQKISTEREAKRTLSFINRIIPSGSSSLADKRKTIRAFRITIMNGTTQLDDFYITNTTNNGGQHTDITEGESFDEYPFDILTVQCGQNMFTASTINATHWFVGAFTLNDADCTDPNLPYFSQELFNVYRFDVDEGECNDFDIVEFSWLNSYGVRDYFDFRKRRDYNISIDRNTYEQIDGTWSSADYEINSYDRGEKTFSQSIQERYTCNTHYLEDYEAEFLKNLYISPDVKVRFQNEAEYYSVTVEDSQWTEQTKRKNKLFQNTITFRLAHKINSQRG